jgi:hypothetical protein
MKKVIILSFMALAGLSCNSSTETATEESATEMSHEDMSHEGHDHASEMAEDGTYACPMACEGDKTYAEAGKCPVCKMDLEPVAQVVE